MDRATEICETSVKKKNTCNRNIIGRGEGKEIFKEIISEMLQIWETIIYISGSSMNSN